MWKNKKRYRDNAASSGDHVDAGDDEGDDDGYRVEYASQHSGCIPLETIKASEEYKERVVLDEKAPKKKYAICFGYLGKS